MLQRASLFHFVRLSAPLATSYSPLTTSYSLLATKIWLKIRGLYAMQKKNLVIIGAGASGLMAASELCQHYNVTILEARNRIGGRIHSQQSSTTPFIIETGAEFIHGKLPITLQLLKEAGIRYVPMEGNMYRKEKGKWNEQTDFVEGWDKLVKQMGKLEKDMTMHEFLDTYFAGDKYTELRRHTTAFAEGFDIADIKKASVKALYREWSHEQDVVYRVPEGYSSLMVYLQQECENKGCKILMNQLVKQIDWDNQGATVHTINEDKFSADKIIVTIPVNLLQLSAGRASINFTPPLDGQVKAANEVGVGAVIKVIFFFKKAFWEKDTGFIFSNEVIPTWWTQLPDRTPVLTGWLGGPKAERLSDHSEEDIIEKGLHSLSSIFELTIDELKENLTETHVFNWQQDEFARGAYTYNMPGSSKARECLNESIDGIIYFAGEAMYDGASPGTVEAALATGKDISARLLR